VNFNPRSLILWDNYRKETLANNEKIPLDFDGQLISGGLDEFLTLVMAHLKNARPVDVDDEVAIPQSRVVGYRVEGDLMKKLMKRIKILIALT
jgi:hypothetical protein